MVITDKKIERLQQKAQRRKLVKILTSPYELDSIRASEALVNIGDEKVVKLLLKLLNNGKERTVKLAVMTLGQLKDQRAVEPIAEQLKSVSAEVREACLDALYLLMGENCIPYLTRALLDDSETVSQKASELLIKIGKANYQAIMPLLNHHDAEVQLKVIELFGEIENKEVINTLLEQLDKADSRKKIYLIKALSNYSEAVAVGTILDAIKNNESKEFLSNEMLLNALMNWKEKPAMQNYLCELVVKTKSETLAHKLFTFINFFDDSQKVRKAIESAGFTISEHDVDGWGSFEHLEDKEGNRIY